MRACTAKCRRPPATPLPADSAPIASSRFTKNITRKSAPEPADTLIRMDTQAVVLQLRYGAWATRRVLESTLELSPDELSRDLSNSFGGIQGTLTHIFQGDAIWFDRLMGTPTRNLGAYEPAPDFAQFSKNWLALLDRYVSWAEGLKPGEWDRIVHYRFINGDAGQQPVWQL